MPTSPASERAEIRSLHASWFWKCPPHTGRKHDTPIALPVSHGGPMSYPLSLPPPRTRLWAFYPISRHWTTERFILAIATTYLPESEIRRSPSVSLTEDTRVQRRPQGHGTTRPQDPWAKPELVQKFCSWHGVWSSSRVHSYAIHICMRPWFINSWLKDEQTSSLINLLANQAEPLKQEGREASFCKTAAYPVLGPGPKN